MVGKGGTSGKKITLNYLLTIYSSATSNGVDLTPKGGMALMHKISTKLTNIIYSPFSHICLSTLIRICKLWALLSILISLILLHNIIK